MILIKILVMKILIVMVIAIIIVTVMVMIRLMVIVMMAFLRSFESIVHKLTTTEIQSKNLMQGLSCVRFDSEKNTVKRSKQREKLKEREVAGSD